MGQEEVEEFLKEQKKINPDKWFSTKEVIEALREKGFTYTKCGRDTIRRNLRQLSLYGRIKFKTIGFWSARIVFHAN